MNKYHKQIEDAIKDRAIMYLYLFEGMEKKFGAESAKEIFKKATYRRGVDKGEKYKNVKNDLNKVAKIFTTCSSADGNIFKPKKIKSDKNTATLTMSSCPLVAAWKEQGVSKSKIKLMCNLAKEIDYGTFESNGLKLNFRNTIGAGGKCCRLELRR